MIYTSGSQSERNRPLESNFEGKRGEQHKGSEKAQAPTLIDH